MTEAIKSKSINLVISSCLLGNAVRYDGQHQFHDLINKSLGDEFNVIPVCPEVMAGLSVPRPPVQLVKLGSTVQALGVDNAALNVTKPLLTAAQEFIRELPAVYGFILKARSPSCGVGSTPVFNESLVETERSNGLFAGQIIKAYPDMPVTDESLLVSQDEVETFLNRVREYYLSQYCDCQYSTITSD